MSYVVPELEWAIAVYIKLCHRSSGWVDEREMSNRTEESISKEN